jgi:hypothetical protein
MIKSPPVWSDLDTSDGTIEPAKGPYGYAALAFEGPALLAAEMQHFGCSRHACPVNSLPLPSIFWSSRQIASGHSSLVSFEIDLPGYHWVGERMATYKASGLNLNWGAIAPRVQDALVLQHT